MKRRSLLKSLALPLFGTSTFSLAPNFFINTANAAQTKTLIVIFQRGACDGLNTCVPYGDENYQALRPTIGIAPPDINNPAAAIDLDGYFGLHPGLSSLKSIYDQGQLAILPTTHYSQATHSHFDGQHFIENASLDKTLDGWLNRYLAISKNTNDLGSIAFANSLPQSLKGKMPVSVFRELSEFNLNLPNPDGSNVLNTLSSVYSQPDISNPYRNQILALGRQMVKNLDKLQPIDSQLYLPENGAIYPKTLYGRQLKQTAQLIKHGVGLEVVTLDIQGWDTHARQGGGASDSYHFLRHKEFSDGIAAIYKDLGNKTQDVVIMTCTEFGRTAKENASGGTDHGDASTWFVLGGNVNGGIYGAWPGLATSQLRRGRYLEFSIDYRDILGDILTNHLHLSDISTVLTDHTYSPLGVVT